MLSKLQELVRFSAPIHFVVRSFARHQARAILFVCLLGLVGAALNAGGFLLVLPVLNALSGNAPTLEIGPFSVDSNRQALAGLLVAAVLCVALGLFLRFRILRASLQILRTTAEEAAVRGAMRLSVLGEDFNLYRAVSAVTGRIAFGCGFVMRQVSVGVANLVQLVVFVGAMLWLSPLITLLLLPAALVVMFLYGRSMVSVAQAASAREGAARSLRDEVDEIADLIDDGDLSEDELRRHIHTLHREGAHGEALEGKVDVKRKIMRGPMIVEALLPMALVPLAVIALTTDVWRTHAGAVVVFVLLLRTSIGLAQRLAGLLIMVGRFHGDISCYMELQTSDDPQSFERWDDEDNRNDPRDELLA